MKKNYKNNNKKNIYKMDLLEDLRMSLLSFNFVMIHIIHKILVFIKSHLHYLKHNIFECFLRSIIDFYFFKKVNFFHNIY